MALGPASFGGLAGGPRTARSTWLWTFQLRGPRWAVTGWGGTVSGTTGPAAPTAPLSAGPSPSWQPRGRGPYQRPRPSGRTGRHCLQRLAPSRLHSHVKNARERAGLPPRRGSGWRVPGAQGLRQDPAFPQRSMGKGEWDAGVGGGAGAGAGAGGGWREREQDFDIPRHPRLASRTEREGIANEVDES